MSSWIIHMALLGGVAFLIFRLLRGEFPAYIFWIALLLKLVAGLVLGYLFYNYYGEGDTITFFEAAKSTPIADKEPRTQFFISLLSPLVKSTGESYWITSLWLSMVSFVACWFATVTLARIYANLRKVIATCFLFIPSIVFWSSGIMKDTLAFAAMVTSVSLIVKFYRQSKLSITELIILLLCGFLLLKIKHYLLITTLLFGGVLCAAVFIRKVNSRWKWFFAATIFILAILSTQFIHPYLKINRVAWTLYENNQAIIQKSDSDSRLNMVMKDDTWFSVIKNVPQALHAGLFRPSILDYTPMWGWIHRVENLILTILIFLSLLLSFKLKPKIDWPLFVASIVCIILLAVMLPLSTPNFGTLVRYKNAYMPYLSLISSILPYRYLASKRSE